jgi:hypothetical protein
MQQSENFNTNYFCPNLQRHQTSFCGEYALLTAEKRNSTKESHKFSRWRWYRTRKFFICQFFLVVRRLVVSKKSNWNRSPVNRTGHFEFSGFWKLWVLGFLQFLFENFNNKKINLKFFAQCSSSQRLLLIILLIFTSFISFFPLLIIATNFLSKVVWTLGLFA